jgi:hypothetical protein
LRKVIAAALLVLTVLWLPFDITSIRDGLQFQPELALGISLKLLMHILAIVGLLMDKTFGYAFLLGATIQGLLVSSSSLRAIPLNEWLTYKDQLLKPAFDILVRIACLLFLATRPGRIVGKEATA